MGINYSLVSDGLIFIYLLILVLIIDMGRGEENRDIIKYM
jgi:hypothetical protein